MIDRTDSLPPTPESLVARYRASGDPQAIGALFDATAPALFRIALSLVPDATMAEDVLQETYVVALEGLGRYDPARPVMPWLVGILHNMAKRARRGLARRPRADRLAALGGAAGGNDPMASDGATLRVREAIDGLEEPYRSVALLRWQYGLSPAEIADVRGEPPGTTRSLLSRALTRLRASLRGAAAVLLLPPAPRGLQGVRDAVMDHAASVAAGTVTAATAGGLSALAKGGLAAAAVAVIGGAVWLAAGAFSGRSTSGTTAPAEETAAAERRPDGPPATPPRADGPETPAEPDVPPPPPPDPEPPTAPPVVEVPPEPMSPDREGDGPIPFLGTPPPPELAVDPAMGGAPLAAPPAVPPAAPVPPNPSGPTDDEGVPLALATRIQNATESGVRWLRSVQLSDGSWGRVQGNQAYDPKASADAAYEHPAGATALVLYALLKSGVPADDAVVKMGFAFLKSKHRIPGGSYEISALLLAVTATGKSVTAADDGQAAEERLRLTGEMRAWAQQLLDALRSKRAKAKTLGWRYNLDGGGVPPGGNEDLSSTQLAALALLACERAGLKTDASTWDGMLTFAMRQQEPDGPRHPRAVVTRGPKAPGGARGAKAGSGTSARDPTPMDRARGFAYILNDALPPDEGRPTGGMTACGLGVIQIARYALAARKDAAWKARDHAAVQQAVYDGLAWLDHNWSAYENPFKKRENVYHIYYLYCVERAFDLLGNQRLGSHLWYAEMAEQLLPRQSPKGFWDSQTTHKPGAVLDTSFALLFLQRATTRDIHLPAVTGPSDAAPTDGR